MKVFVTVGTTSFDDLIKNVDDAIVELEGFSFTFQIAKGKYKPKESKYFEFTSEVEKFYNNADLVITHAGAGSIYRLLELNKKIIIVPNMKRVDKHQEDISSYMFENNHVMLLSDFSRTVEMISSANYFAPTPFVKNKFFVKDEIVNFIQGCI
ncbi:PssE/Cps14G family polysaccharide biosynthesis glycosyltransferase [Vibrio sp. F13]|uniref:PssE/Cps14G family polysaccharide biosynthesis glycosyltransferase n=1 Tax=Vibrio sp. F13 TaxID=2070777 RepID=UPI0010BD007A|nr:PssE/Cps14G family polysaccharide biosynthesis glycosyltransferase [Vibrio sp. F13]TKF48031.1 glycosyltransferase [Vibrio sp. F13]